MIATLPDALRLVAVPILGWAAVRDVRTRRVPNRTWYPLAALGIALLAWDAHRVWGLPYARRLFVLQVAVSVGIVVPAAYLLWRIGGFGGADAKALMALAVTVPDYPAYVVAGVSLPHEETRIGAFALTVLTDAVLVALAYPAVFAAQNVRDGRLGLRSLIGVPVRWDEVVVRHGRLLETPSGFTRGGLDLDALRMYLRWRRTTLADLRADASLRDPATVPEDTGDPTDGAVATDGGRAAVDGAPEADADAADRATDDDPWAAAAFLDDVEGSAYGTTPDQLRDGLDLLVDAEEVWISPGIPFLVPVFAGLVVALTYGDLLFGLLRLAGVV